MSDHEVPRSEQPEDANDAVDSANAGGAEVDAAAVDAPGATGDVRDDAFVESSALTDSSDDFTAADTVTAADTAADTDTAAADTATADTATADASESASTSSVSDAVDPDLAAFEEAERAHPGTFVAPEPAPAPPAPVAADPVEAPASAPTHADSFDAPDMSDERIDAAAAVANADATLAEVNAASEGSIADTAYQPSDVDAEDTATRVVPSEPVAYSEPVSYSEPTVASEPVVAPPAYAQQQPIFVQAPEPPRERNNRGTAAGIGLLATLSFAILYLGTALGLGALAGDVTGENFVDALIAPLTTWGLWVPVVVFFIGFWLLGAIVNRGRWGRWVVFGIIVGLFAYVGHILGQLFEAPFWMLTASEGNELVGSQLLAPLAIAAFVFGRELTIWFGAWVARSGARKTELNAEAQREYERTLEAGPTLPR
ncbi:ABC transporter [Microbacterium sp. A94]|uniref:ABC transporter n=1 Tax=Microbacterium sp. A94 TaxID=3450717 RepID=UPI003F431B12